MICHGEEADATQDAASAQPSVGGDAAADGDRAEEMILGIGRSRPERDDAGDAQFFDAVFDGVIVVHENLLWFAAGLRHPESYPGRRE